MSHSFFIFCLEHILPFGRHSFFSVSFGFAEALLLLPSTFFILYSSFPYLPLYVLVALAEVVWEPPLTLAPRVSPYQVSLVSVMVGEE